MEKSQNTNIQKFIKGLAGYGITYEEVKDNWKYAGGDTGRHRNYYTLCYSHLDPPEATDRCVCDHRISENCYITDGSEFLVVGNCCIKKFITNKTRTCDTCGGAHKNRIVNRCNGCRVGICDKCGTICNSSFKTHAVCPKPRSIGSCLTCQKTIESAYQQCFICHANSLSARN